MAKGRELLEVRNLKKGLVLFKCYGQSISNIFVRYEERDWRGKIEDARKRVNR